MSCPKVPWECERSGGVREWYRGKLAVAMAIVTIEVTVDNLNGGAISAGGRRG